MDRETRDPWVNSMLLSEGTTVLEFPLRDARLTIFCENTQTHSLYGNTPYVIHDNCCSRWTDYRFAEYCKKKTSHQNVDRVLSSVTDFDSHIDDEFLSLYSFASGRERNSITRACRFLEQRTPLLLFNLVFSGGKSRSKKGIKHGKPRGRFRDRKDERHALRDMGVLFVVAAECHRS